MSVFLIAIGGVVRFSYSTKREAVTFLRHYHSHGFEAQIIEHTIEIAGD